MTIRMRKKKLNCNKREIKEESKDNTNEKNNGSQEPSNYQPFQKIPKNPLQQTIPSTLSNPFTQKPIKYSQNYIPCIHPSLHRFLPHVLGIPRLLVRLKYLIRSVLEVPFPVQHRHPLPMPSEEQKLESRCPCSEGR